MERGQDTTGNEIPSMLLFKVYYQMICLTTFIEVKGTCVLQEYGDKRKLLRGLDIYGYRHWLSTLACLYCFHLHFKTERSHYSTRFLLSLNRLGHGNFSTIYCLYPLTTLMLELLFECLIEFVRGVLEISAPHRVTPRGDQVNMTVGTLCTLSSRSKRSC